MTWICIKHTKQHSKDFFQFSWINGKKFAFIWGLQRQQQHLLDENVERMAARQLKKKYLSRLQCEVMAPRDCFSNKLRLRHYCEKREVFICLHRLPSCGALGISCVTRISHSAAFMQIEKSRFERRIRLKSLTVIELDCDGGIFIGDWIGRVVALHRPSGDWGMM